MNTVQLGTHSKIVARREDQPRIRTFYRDVLGGTLTKATDDVDFIRLGDFYLAVLYGHPTSSDEALRTSIWLELCANDPAALTKAILAFGVHRIETFDAEHLYFQGPGGQVFRVVQRGEDLSRFEQ